MSIRDRQIQDTTNRILTRELQAGHYPDANVVNRALTQYFKERMAGLPRFTYDPLANGTPSSSKHYNAIVDALHEDLTVVFKELGYQSNRLLAIANLYNTDKLMLERQIRYLERSLESLYSQAQQDGNTFFDAFVDFKQIDFSGDARRNIAKTNALIDLRFGAVTLAPLPSGSLRYSLDNATAWYKVLTPHEEATSLAPISNALRDSINESWRLSVSNSTPATMQVEVTINLEEQVDITAIYLQPNSPRSTQVQVLVSLDGENWKALSTHSIWGLSRWGLDKTKVQYIKLVLTKTEPDNSDANNYYYLFGLQTISLAVEEHQTEAVLVSKAHMLQEPINYVQLVADEYLPPGTNIRYYIGLDDSVNPVAWHEINNGETISLGVYENNHQHLGVGSDNYGSHYAKKYGVDYHSIGKLTHTPKPNTVRVYLGANMWERNTLSNTIWVGDPEQPNLLDWQGRGETTWFVNTNSPLRLERDCYNRFTIYVKADQPVTIEAPIESAGNCRYNLYLNNINVPVINGHCTYSFQAGWNRLQICTYAYEAHCFVMPHLDLREVGSHIYARHRPLVVVSEYDMLHNTSKTDYSRCAIVGQDIVVNYDPGSLGDIKYFLNYQYPTDDFSNIAIRFIAMLSCKPSSKHRAPELREYRLLLR